MKTIPFHNIICSLLLTFAISFPIIVNAQWQQIRYHDAAYSAYLTKEGNLLLSDYVDDGTGGIYISEDKGETWNKTSAEDHSYNKFYSFGSYIYAIGTGAVIARSSDEGRTWQMLSYRDAASEVMDDYAIDNTVAYAITDYDGKLFIGDFSGGGIMYSEDYGLTWKRTDIESISYTMQYDGYEETYVENIYQLVSYKGNLYAFGVYYVFRYDAAENNWQILRDDSNFMAVSAMIDGKMFCGRSCPNDDPEAPFLEMTSDFDTWTQIKGPEDIITRNVRVLTSDEHFIYAATQDRGAYVLDYKSGSWYNMCEGYPVLYPDDESRKGFYHAPTQMFTDSDYIYLVIYDYPGAPDKTAGLYKYPKSEIINRTSIDAVKVAADYEIEGNDLVFNVSNTSHINLYDITGKSVASCTSDGKLNIVNIPDGIYIYEITYGSEIKRGKLAVHK